MEHLLAFYSIEVTFMRLQFDNQILKHCNESSSAPNFQER